MEIFEALDTRQTIRSYGDKVPTVDEIKRIINSARLAPSACNAQNWKFIAVLNNEVKQRLADAILEKYDEFEKILPQEEYQKMGRFKSHSTFFTSAPLLIVCVQTYAPKFLEGILENAGLSAKEIQDIRPDSQILSMGGAVENMSLASWALGYGSCWMVAPLIAQAKMRQILNLNDDEQILSLLAIGEPKVIPTRAIKKILDDVIEIIE